MDKIALLQPFRSSRSFTALWGGQLMSGFGDQAFSVILPMVVYSLTGSPVTMGVLMTLRVIPHIFLQPLTGVLVDRFPRVSMMLASDSMRFGLLIVLSVLGVSHHLTIPALDVTVFVYGAIAIQGLALLGMSLMHWLPGLMLMMAISSAGSMLFGIVHEGMLQELVPEEFFGRVISLEVFSATIAQPIGYLLTGVLSRNIGGIHAMMIEAATMFMVVIATLFLPSIRHFK